MFAKELKPGDVFVFPESRCDWHIVAGELTVHDAETTRPHRMMRLDGRRPHGGLAYVILEPKECRGYTSHMGNRASVALVKEEVNLVH